MKSVPVKWLAPETLHTVSLITYFIQYSFFLLSKLLNAGHIFAQNGCLGLWSFAVSNIERLTFHFLFQMGNIFSMQVWSLPWIDEYCSKGSGLDYSSIWRYLFLFYLQILTRHPPMDPLPNMGNEWREIMNDCFILVRITCFHSNKDIFQKEEKRPDFIDLHRKVFGEEPKAVTRKISNEKSLYLK